MNYEQLDAVPAEFEPIITAQEQMFLGVSPPKGFSRLRREAWRRPVGLVTGEFDLSEIDEIRRRREKVGYVPITRNSRWLLSRGRSLTGDVVAVTLFQLDDTGRTVSDPQLVSGSWNGFGRFDVYNHHTEAWVALYGRRALRMRRCIKK